MGDVVMETSGYRRLMSREDERAVTWWLVCRFPNGHVFARGGRCRTSKLARTLIYRAKIAARDEMQERERERSAERVAA